MAKLESSGLDVEFAVSMGVAPVTGPGDLPEELQGNPYAAPVPGMLFPWHTTEDTIVWQYRPDAPVDNDEGKPVKYVFPTGKYQNFARVRGPREERATMSLVVEGTLQSLAAARYAAPDVAVFAVPGCWGWSEQQVPTADLVALSGTAVVISLDADAATNPDVYDAGMRLIDAVATMAGSAPEFTRLGAGGSTGLDDLIATVPEQGRATVLANLIRGARARPADNKSSLKPRGPSAEFSAFAADMPVAPAHDTGQATAWVQATRGLHRFLLHNTWRSYLDGRWNEVAEEVIGSSIGEVLNEQASSYAEAARSASSRDEERDLRAVAATLWSNAKISSVVGRASRMSGLHIHPDDMDRHPDLWCAANTIIDLETGEAREHDPELLMSRGSPVAYDPDAACPRFDYFLADVLPDDDVAEFVLQCFAMAMSGRVTDHVLPVFLGPKRNGKSTMLRIMSALFGEYAALTPEELVVEAGRTSPGDMEKLQADLFGRRLVTYEETKQSRPWNVDKIKNLTGGGQMKGRRLYRDSFEFAPSHTLVLATNHQPRVAGGAEPAFWSRYRQVPFSVSLEGREDPSLESGIIADELPGVLNRLLAAGARYRGAGRLLAPSAVLRASEASRVDEDPYEKFVRARLIRTDRVEDRVPHDDVYAELTKWWADNVDYPKSPPARNKVTAPLQQVLGLPLHADVRTEAERNPRRMRMPDRPDNDRPYVWLGLVWSDEDPEGGSDVSPIPCPPLRGTTGDTGKGDLTTTDSSAVHVSPVETSMSPVVSPTGVDQEITDSAGQPLSVPLVPSVPHTCEKYTETERVDTETGQNGQGGGVNGYRAGETSNSREQMGDRADIRATVTPIAGGDQVTGAPIVFDLETASADQLHDYPDPRAFVRIAGLRAGGQTRVHVGPDAVVDAVLSSRKVIAHNAIAFDLPALARVDPRIDALAMTRDGRVLDTMITESVLHPVLNEGGRPGEIDRAMVHFSLDEVAKRRGVTGKVDELKRLATLHGGYDMIPLDDPDYLTYCEGDVAADHRIAALQAREISGLPPERRDYLTREHRVHAIAAQMGASGIAVDRALLDRRYWATANRKADLSRKLIAEYDLPTTRADGKPATSPAATKEGKAAILTALCGLGVNPDDIAKTPKNAYSFSGDSMREVAERYAEHPRAEEIATLTEVVAGDAAVRTIYKTVTEHLRADGRVHPSVVTFQSSGRWSVRKPGLTVLGKREGKVIERAIFTASDAEHALFAIDLSQIDSRSIAVHSQDHAYLDLFGPGLDAHEIVARMVWGDAVYDADPYTLRERVKAITHGLPYGLGIEKLISHTKVPRVDAERVIATMNERFPRLQAWKEEVREQAQSTGWLDNGFGRWMRCDQTRAYTQGPALMGQGCARDAMAECLLRLPDYIVRMLRAQVHDEAVFEVPRQDAEDIIEVITDAFNWSMSIPGLDRPVQVEAEAGRLAPNWAGCYSERHDWMLT